MRELIHTDERKWPDLPHSQMYGEWSAPGAEPCANTYQYWTGEVWLDDG